MFSKKKPSGKRDHSNKSLSQYGLFDIPSFEDGTGYEENNNDSDLEAELLALNNSDYTKPKARPKKIPQVNLDNMIAESLKDIPSDEELSGDDEDPDLLNELDELSGTSPAENESVPNAISNTDNNTTKLLVERLKLYEVAEANAKTTGEISRARRFGRGIKMLQDLLKQAQSGKPINNDDIPPEITINATKRPTETMEDKSKIELPSPVVVPKEDSPSSSADANSQQNVALSQEKQELLNKLILRKNEYKSAAVAAKKVGDNNTALNYVKIVKQFEAVVTAVENNQEVDITGMPESPNPIMPETEKENIQTQEQQDANEDVIPEPTLITANSVAEALEQRLQVYKQQEQAAKEAGNSSKARRMGRIVKQYQDAIKQNNANKPIPIDDLPTPPGYAPIPIPGTMSPPKQQPLVPTRKSPEKPKSTEEAAKESPTSSHPSKPGASGSTGSHTRAEKQLQFLLLRQKEFKIAALNAKKKGELDQAKEFLRTAKGFEPLLKASQAGLPVDIASLPVPPSARSQLDNEYEVVMGEECIEEDTDLDVLSRLEAQLSRQLKMCLSTRDHNKAIGDVAGTNRFEHLALTVTRDLDIVRVARRTPGSTIPKFHYERKEFSIVKTITELNDNDLELTIVRGINYNCTNPKDIDTYVKFEFPYPQEEPVKDKTSTIRDTNNPEYNAVFTIPIQRTARTCQRTFKRHSIKLEVYSKGGFFRSDALLGIVSVKLVPLETQCEIHDSFDLMDGRKKAGGKLEIKMRVRNPLQTKQVEQLSEKWLVVDH